MQETLVRSLGWEDSLEKEKVTHSSILVGKFHGQRSLTGYTICGVTKNWTQLSPYIREGNGNPLHFSYLENSVDGGAWWTAVHGVTRV